MVDVRFNTLLSGRKATLLASKEFPLWTAVARDKSRKPKPLKRSKAARSRSKIHWALVRDLKLRKVIDEYASTHMSPTEIEAFIDVSHETLRKWRRGSGVGEESYTQIKTALTDNWPETDGGQIFTTPATGEVISVPSIADWIVDSEISVEDFCDRVGMDLELASRIIDLAIFEYAPLLGSMYYRSSDQAATDLNYLRGSYLLIHSRETGDGGRQMSGRLRLRYVLDVGGGNFLIRFKFSIPVDPPENARPDDRYALYDGWVRIAHGERKHNHIVWLGQKRVDPDVGEGLDFGFFVTEDFNRAPDELVGSCVTIARSGLPWMGDVRLVRVDDPRKDQEFYASAEFLTEP